MSSTTIPDPLYRLMLAAVTTTPDGYVTRGPGAATISQINALTRPGRRWARLHRERRRDARTGQLRWDTLGAWLQPYGRCVLRDEIIRRGDLMPAQLERRPAPAVTR